MTAKEAINHLGTYRFRGINHTTAEFIPAPDVWQEALEMAISALREQEERSKGCEFCKGAKYIYGELFASGHVDSDHDFVHGHYGDLSICPVCGRRLEEV